MARELFRALADTIGEEDWIISDSIRYDEDRLYLYDDEFCMWIRCHANTRSVSYHNMIDKNGKKVFASLSEDGIGGDYIKFSDDYIPLVISGFNTNEPKGIKLVCMHTLLMMDSYRYEVIGIHKG